MERMILKGNIASEMQKDTLMVKPNRKIGRRRSDVSITHHREHDINPPVAEQHSTDMPDSTIHHQGDEKLLNKEVGTNSMTEIGIENPFKSILEESATEEIEEDQSNVLDDDIFKGLSRLSIGASPNKSRNSTDSFVKMRSPTHSTRRNKSNKKKFVLNPRRVTLSSTNENGLMRKCKLDTCADSIPVTD